MSPATGESRAEAPGGGVGAVATAGASRAEVPGGAGAVVTAGASRAGGMRPATRYRAAGELRLLVVDAKVGAMHVARADEFAQQLDRGDLIVVNDAATLPASFRSSFQGSEVEIRLLGAVDDRTWTAALLGAGDWRTRTEDRPAPPAVSVGDVLEVGSLTATVVRVHPESPRLVTFALAHRADPSLPALWSALYREGRPVQYAHVPKAYALWDVQNVYAGRPWAVEMPSAGRILTFEALAALAARGVAVATLTHAAGISSVGDPRIDRLLPLPERYEIPRATWQAIRQTRSAGGRVVAVGTSVVRALESAARTGQLAAITDLHISRRLRRRVVDGLVTGLHERQTSHFELLGAFADRAVLDASLREAESAHLLAHEMGDACLLWAKTRAGAAEAEAAPSPRAPGEAREHRDRGPQGKEQQQEARQGPLPARRPAISAASLSK